MSSSGPSQQPSPPSASQPPAPPGQMTQPASFSSWVATTCRTGFSHPFVVRLRNGALDWAPYCKESSVIVLGGACFFGMLDSAHQDLQVPVFCLTVITLFWSLINVARDKTIKTVEHERDTAKAEIVAKVDEIRTHKETIADREEAIQDLEDKLEDFQTTFPAVLDSMLLVLQMKMELSATERISLYRHDVGKRTFRLLARYSSQEARMTKGRTEYPDDQGVLARLLNEVWYDDPDLGAVPAEYGAKQLERYQIPVEVANGFRMKSMCYYGMQLLEPRDGKVVAYLLCESVNANGLKSKIIKRQVVALGPAVAAYIAAMPRSDGNIGSVEEDE